MLNLVFESPFVLFTLLTELKYLTTNINPWGRAL